MSLEPSPTLMLSAVRGRGKRVEEEKEGELEDEEL